MKLFEELKRRNVFRVGIAYLAISWVLLQITDVIVPILVLPDWLARAVLFLLAIGSAETGDESKTIVVLPLDNLMNDPEQAYFVEGMHEALITELYSYAIAGQPEEARKILADLMTQFESGAVAPIHLSMVHFGLGELDSAIDLLEQAFKARNSHMMYINRGPKFDPLRGNNRFKALIKKMGW